MTDPIRRIVLDAIAASPVAARAVDIEPAYRVAVDTTVALLTAVRRASHGVLTAHVVERVTADMLLHPEVLHAADLAMRERAIGLQRARLNYVPEPVRVDRHEAPGVVAAIEAQQHAPIAEIARRYDVALDPGMTLDEAVTRIVEQVRCRG